MALADIFAAIQAHAITAGSNEAPTHPTESHFGTPFSIVYPDEGVIIGESGLGMRNVETLIFDYHVARQLLPSDVLVATTFFEAFNALIIADPTLGGTVDTMLTDESGKFKWKFGVLEYAGKKTIGYRYWFPIKRRS